MPAAFHRTYVFVDGGYVRDSLDAFGAPWEQLKVHDLGVVAAGNLGKWLGEQCGVARVFLYDAFDESRAETPGTKDSKVAAWLNGNDREMDTHVQRGRLAGERRREQKGVDVQLAVDALSGAYAGTFEVAVLVAGDGDFAPLAEALRLRGPLVAAACFSKSLSRDLRRAVDRVHYFPEDASAFASWTLPSSG